jgi:hypothetical protein
MRLMDMADSPYCTTTTQVNALKVLAKIQGLP